VNQQIFRAVRERAANRCEYCSLPESSFPLPFQIDHILAEKHGGGTTEANVALVLTAIATKGRISPASTLRRARSSGCSIPERTSGHNTSRLMALN
jgi:hypothetical protein